MGDIRFDNQAEPLTPAAGKTLMYIDSVDLHAKTKDANGVVIDLTTSATYVAFYAKKNTAGTIPKGKTLCQVGYDSVNNIVLVELAKADSASTMPCIGISKEEITDSIAGLYIMFGDLSGIDTSAFSTEDSLYVSKDTAGELTNVRPTVYTSLIQKVAQVGEVDATTGSIIVMGAYRSNDIPNLQQDYLWVGDANGQPRAVLKTTVGVTDHGGLTGLGDDDHTQYHTDGRADTWLGTKSTTNLSEGTNLYYTTERAQDDIGGILVDTTTIDFTYNDGTPSITAAVLPGGVDHNSLLNYSANRHIDHTGVSISAGVGLTGGGDISSNRTLSLDINGLTAETSADDADTIAIYDNSEGAINKMTRANFLNGIFRFPVYRFNAEEMRSPVTADWNVNALAPVAADTVNTGLLIRRFDDTTEEGAGFQIKIPTGATNITFNIVSKAVSTPGGAVKVEPEIHYRIISNNAAVGAWSSYVLTDLDFTTNVHFQYDTQTIALSTLSITAGNVYQFEITRNVSSGDDTLTGDWGLLQIEVVFS